MHILIAPNAFKNSLSAPEVARAIQDGLLASRLSCTTECFPVGDGGDGTGMLLSEHLHATEIQATVHDPMGRVIDSSFGLTTDGNTAIIEMADASGLRLIPERDPMHASTIGTGELIRAALDRGAREILLSIGGSATVDGGAGILYALGMRYFDTSGTMLLPIPLNLVHLDHIDLSGLDPRVARTTFTVLCDVDNPLLGPEGAAPVYAPQKGAGPGDVRILSGFLQTWRDEALRATGKDMASVTGGGAAGGVAAGLFVFLNARLQPGAEYFLQATGFDAALSKADLVITGEGSLDAQTLRGKAPYAVACAARALKIPVIGLGGRIQFEPLSPCFDALLSITPEPMGLPEALASTAANLKQSAVELGNLATIFPGRNAGRT